MGHQIPDYPFLGEAPDRDGGEQHGVAEQRAIGHDQRLELVLGDAGQCIANWSTWNCGQIGVCQYIDFGSGKNMPER
jgi:hypothetical protein